MYIISLPFSQRLKSQAETYTGNICYDNMRWAIVTCMHAGHNCQLSHLPIICKAHKHLEMSHYTESSTQSTTSTRRNIRSAVLRAIDNLWGLAPHGVHALYHALYTPKAIVGPQKDRLTYKYKWKCECGESGQPWQGSWPSEDEADHKLDGQWVHWFQCLHHSITSLILPP